MKSKPLLEAEKDSFTLLDLFRKAALYKGLKLKEGISRASSEKIKEYFLDDKLLVFLEERGIKQQLRPDCDNDIFSLVDENPQEKIQGQEPSNCWNFAKSSPSGDDGSFNLWITLSVGLGVNIEKGGIEFWPQAHGTFVSTANRLPNLRMFKALVESDKNAHIVAKELASSDGNIIVTWTELGIDGICKLSDLFIKFADQNETIRQLGRDKSIFNPLPFPQYEQSGDELFIVKPAQTRVTLTWYMQLEEYRTKLSV